MGRRTLDAAATKIRILEAVVELSRKIGIENITFQKVAKEAGISYYGVHYHFGQKEKGLLLAAVEYVGGSAQKYIAEWIETRSAEPSAKLLEEYVIGTFQWACDMPNHAVLWVYYYYLCSADGALRKVNQTAVAKARQRIVRLLSEDIGRRHYRELKDIESLALKIHQQLVGGVVGSIAEAGESSVQTHRDGVLAAIRDLIRAHESPPHTA